MHKTHQRADDPLDYATEVRSSGWAPFDGNTVLGAAALECLGMELGAVVDAQPERFALHGPVGRHLTHREPGRFVHRDVRQAKANRRRRRCFQRDVESGDAAAVGVDGNG